MSIKSVAAKLFAKKIYKETQAWAKNPVATQNKVLQKLIKEAKGTQFGIDHHFNTIKSSSDFSRSALTNLTVILSPNRNCFLETLPIKAYFLSS